MTETWQMYGEPAQGRSWAYDGPDSFDVYERAAECDRWLGYAQREYVEEQGMMWVARIPSHPMSAVPGVGGVVLDYYDTEEDAVAAIREHWEN